MRRYKVLLTAGKDVPLPASGEYLRVISGSAEFEIQPDTGQTLAGMQSGMAWTAQSRFTKLLLKSAVTQTIEIMAGDGRIDDNRSSISGVVDVASKGEVILNASHVVGATAAVLLASSTTRRSILILNNSAGDIFIGAAAVTTGNGLKVSVGQTVTIDKAAQAAVYAIGSAAGLDVRTLSEST